MLHRKVWEVQYQKVTTRCRTMTAGFASLYCKKTRLFKTSAFHELMNQLCFLSAFWRCIFQRMGFLIYLAQEDGDFFQSMKQQLNPRTLKSKSQHFEIHGNYWTSICWHSNKNRISRYSFNTAFNLRSNVKFIPWSDKISNFVSVIKNLPEAWIASWGERRERLAQLGL